MWLNEGWAVFSESMYKEMVYGKEAYKDNMRALLYDVLKNTHHTDGGYYALAGIPHNLTYGSTIYDKGGTVAHSVRGYLGDARFFNMLHDYMNQKAFSSQSSNDFRDFISSNTGINMDDFFTAWVDAPGFVHFAIDSFDTGNSTNPPYTVEVWMRQRLNHKPNYANSNRVPISFMDNQWNRVDTVIEFSGKTGSQTFSLAFKPSVVFCDLEERLADATTDYAKTISATGLIDLPLAFSKMNVIQANDSSLVQITHNWVAPDSLGINYPGLRISTHHFWTVNSIQSSNFDASISFHYYKGVDFDNDIIKNKNDSLVLLFRPHGGIGWQRIHFTKQGIWIAGYMKVNHIKNGDYVLAAYDYHYLGLNDSQLMNDNFSFKISPNPSSDEFHFEMNDEFPASILIYDSAGKQVTKLKMNALYTNHSEANWKPKGLAAGNYIVVLVSEKGRQLYQTKLIISK
jgi:aminopeptidase N